MTVQPAPEEVSDPETPVRLRCSVAVLRHGAVLLLHRSVHPGRDGDGDWVLPGGRPRSGEGMAACARREAAEETGLDVVIGRCLFVFEVICAPPDSKREVELVFEGDVRDPHDPPRTVEEHRHPRFVDLDQLPRLQVRPPIAGHLRALQARGRLAGAAYLGNLWRP